MSVRNFTRIILPEEKPYSPSRKKVILNIKNQHILLAQFPFSIGSHKSNDLVIRDPYISRYHCTITHTDGHYFIEDLDSTNSTRLNNKRISKERLKSENKITLGEINLTISIQTTKKHSPHKKNTFHGIISKSPSMHKIFSLIEKFAPLEETVFILGETGCGKELIAQALHEESNLMGPFVAINCAAIPHNLFESELFGHVKGAFTGAHTNKKGAFELADGGTLFLDEIAELPLEQQTKILRTLETQEFTPLGSEKSKTAAVRVICATHQNLRKQIQKKKFREDLYFRLNVLPLVIPSLGQRKEDIALLAEHFAEQKYKKIDSFVLDTLTSQKWPGNIRELKNTIFHLAAISEEAVITIKDWNSIVQTKTPTAEKLTSIEKKQIHNLLAHYNWNRTKVADSLGISRSTLYRRIERYKIQPSSSRT